MRQRSREKGTEVGGDEDPGKEGRGGQKESEREKGLRGLAGDHTPTPAGLSKDIFMTLINSSISATPCCSLLLSCGNKGNHPGPGEEGETAGVTARRTEVRDSSSTSQSGKARVMARPPSLPREGPPSHPTQGSASHPHALHPLALCPSALVRTVPVFLCVPDSVL